MAIIENAGARSARFLGDRMFQAGLDEQERADRLRVETILTERRKADQIPNALIGYAEGQRERREARQAGRAGKKGATGAGVGLAVGAVVGAFFTGGATLAALPAIAAAGAIGSGIGGAIGSAQEDAPGAGQRAGQYTQSAVSALGKAGAQQHETNTTTETLPDAMFKSDAESAPLGGLDAGDASEPVTQAASKIEDYATIGDESDKTSKRPPTTGLVSSDTPNERMIFLGGDLYYDPATGQTRRVNSIDAAQARVQGRGRYGVATDSSLDRLVPSSPLESAAR